MIIENNMKYLRGDFINKEDYLKRNKKQLTNFNYNFILKEYYKNC